MRFRNIIFSVITVLLFTSLAFAFPYDPDPSQIDGTNTMGGTRSINNLFPGNWTNTLRSLNVDSLRVNNFMMHEFNTFGGGRGASHDLMIWNTPSFNADKVSNDESSWARLVANPGSNVAAQYGLSMFTEHNEMIQCIENMPRTNLTVEYLGEIPRGFPFPMLIFSKNPDRSPEGLRQTGKPLVWIQGNIHGGEWSGGEGALACAYDLAIGRYDNLLDKVNVIVIPRVCADGAKVPIRETYDLYALQWTPNPEARDLNRDNVLLDHHVTRAMRKMNMAYGPHFCIDLHERGNTDINSNITNNYGAKFDNDAGDIGSSGTTILQAPKELTALRYKYMEPDLAQFGEQYAIYMGLYREGQDNYSSGLGTAYQAWSGYVPHPDDTVGGPYGPYSGRGHTGTWVTSTNFDPDAPYLIIPEASFNHRSSRNINSMPGAVSQLFENKSGPTNVGNRGMWDRRVATGYICMLSTITTAANRGDEIVPQLEAMRSRWIEKGKTYDPNDMVPIITIPPLPTYWDQEIDNGDGFPHKRDYGYWIIDLGTTATQPNSMAGNITGMSRYDMTKAVKRVPAGTGNITSNTGKLAGRNFSWVTDNSGDGEVQPIKFEVMWQGWNLRERARPTAYIFEGPYAEEVASRMLIAGIEVKRLARDTTVDVVGWHYAARPSVNFRDSGGTGWGSANRNVNLYPIANRLFEKDTYVVFLGQILTNLIPMYMEPDMPFSAGNGIMLTYMSVALGGASSGALSNSLIGMEMPIYRYTGDVNALRTYDMDFCLPLVDRGAVPRFFSFHTQEEIQDIADECGLEPKEIKVYDYDFQVHARQGNRTTAPALKDGKFNISLPTDINTKGYLIQKKDGTYETLTPNANMIGWNTGTVVVADHGSVPFTVNVNASGRPTVGAGSRDIPVALPSWDDLIGVRIVEIVDPILTTGITLNTNSALILLGSNLQLYETIQPSNASDKSVTWSSDNPWVATVDADGLVTTIGTGSVTITARTVDGGFTDTCNILVTTPASGVTINPSALSLDYGDTYFLMATVEPFNVSNSNLIWSSSNDDVVTVTQGGLVRVVGSGRTVTITATAADGSGVYGTATIYVPAVLVTSVTLDKTSLDLLVGSSDTLIATVLPAHATSKDLLWSSDNPAIATVNQNGLVTGVAPGTTTITAAAQDGSGVFATATVTVLNIPVAGVTLNRTYYMFTSIGATMQLTPTIIPGNATDKTVTWLSATPGVATVSATGLVTSAGTGTTAVIVTTNDGGFTAACNIFVRIGGAGDPSNDIVPEQPALPPGTPGGIVSAEPIIIIPADSTDISLEADMLATILPGFSSEDFHVNEYGVVTLQDWIAQEIAKARLNIYDSEVVMLPVFEAVTNNPGAIVAVSFNVKGSHLMVEGLISRPENVRLMMALSSTSGDFFTYTNVPANFDDKMFTILDAGNNIYSGELDPNGDYKILCFIRDGGDFDLDGQVDGSVWGVMALVSVPVLGVTLSPDHVPLQIGQTFDFSVGLGYLPPIADNKRVTWTSDNLPVATISPAGLVTAVGPGSANIKVTTVDDRFWDISSVLVSTPVSSVTIMPATSTVNVGGMDFLSVTVLPFNASNTSIIWSSDNDAIATVTQGGLVRGVAVGSTTIRATAADGAGAFGTCAVTVVP